ncbi:cobyrinic acid a,c-diamide synthase [Pleomorphomonas diazotrophica]|uniref:Hydrogenobyrinate a,c-diamide synthase n=1 Tax=Pleomorphomonas diazotrophica TaxID=1166257 RepID=A0A1I4SUK1_9HYPH|nr:cobyrinate a,c-diamide synthase [Pleomorphomonas diazotrophica]PKR88540.1 cobyrinic acid a,c-diamide synthase [Pleomorphomonas diazotrophica]SFM68030.1 hydrogenobyrinic acid a,c-diamide synthase (glutamine-hydrolysing) /cobyrinate a,c-diamide synthase [Pleomorphomonas diazotrophica]
MKGFLIASVRSGAGKTTVSLGLMAALARRGLRVAPAKCGPDYIDPAFHAAATGRPGVNLDSWAMTPAQVTGLAAQQAEDADLLVAEGLMGLFDGVGQEPGRTGSSADIAAALGLKVLLVLDVTGQSTSAAAVALGAKLLDPRLTILGVVLNRVGSERHRRLCCEAIEALGLPVLGALPRETAVELPERHLGLVQAEETDDLARRLDALGDFVGHHVDIDRLIDLCGDTAPAAVARPTPLLPPPGQRIALARDAAFSFVYPHHLAAWRAAGAEILPFSPLANEPPEPTADVCWLPGGYPELHADALAAADRFLGGLRVFAEKRPVHGECGGYMVLGQGLVDAGGTRHAMAGLLGLETSYEKRRLHLGYRRAKLLGNGPLGPAGAVLSGHEFHYASILTSGDDQALADVSDAHGGAPAPDGSRRGQVSGSFFHVIARME